MPAVAIAEGGAARGMPLLLGGWLGMVLNREVNGLRFGACSTKLVSHTVLIYYSSCVQLTELGSSTSSCSRRCHEMFHRPRNLLELARTPTRCMPHSHCEKPTKRTRSRLPFKQHRNNTFERARTVYLNTVSLNTAPASLHVFCSRYTMRQVAAKAEFK